MHQVSQICVSCKMSCPKSAKTPHANTHPKTDARRCWTMTIHLTPLMTVKIFGQLSLCTLHCAISQNHESEKNISKGNKFILTTMVMVNAMQCKSACACFIELQSLHRRSVSPHMLLCLFLSVLPFLLNQKKKLKQKEEKNGTGIGEQEKENPSKWPEQNLLSSFSFCLFFVEVSTH